MDPIEESAHITGYLLSRAVLSRDMIEFSGRLCIFIFMKRFRERIFGHANDDTIVPLNMEMRQRVNIRTYFADIH